MGPVVELKGLVRLGVGSCLLLAGDLVAVVATALLVLDPGVGAVALAEVVLGALALLVWSF